MNMKKTLALKIAATLLFVSVYSPMASAQEQKNADDIKDKTSVADQAQKNSRASNSKGLANKVIALSTDISNIDKRNNETDQRITQLEKVIKEKESVKSWIGDAIAKIIADAVGFILFAIIIALGLKHELKKTVKDGLVSIGETLANAFVSTVVPQIETFRNDAISILRDKPIHYMTDADLAAPSHVGRELDKAQLLIVDKHYHDAEKFLKALSAKYPTELKVVAKLYELYNMPEFAEISGPAALAKDCANFLESKKQAFSRVADYYYFLSWAYTKFAGTGKQRIYYELALESADMAIKLEPKNPRWHSLQGIVHHCFGVIVDAVASTEFALNLAQEQSDNEGIARAKNNLAYYYAELGQLSKKEVAIAYAREACQYDNKKSSKEQFSLDTLGFVLMSFSKISRGT